LSSLVAIPNIHLARWRFLSCYFDIGKMPTKMVEGWGKDAERMGKGSRKVGERIGTRMVEMSDSIIFNCFRCV
jgi:hypothetical protein